MKTIGIAVLVLVAIALVCSVTGSLFMGVPWEWNGWSTRESADVPDVRDTDSVQMPPDYDPEAIADAIAERVSAEVNGCRIIHESVIEEGMDHVSTSGDFIHVEYWFEGQPERETVLDASIAGGGRYNFTRGLRGWVWEYKDCTYDEVVEQVMAHIPRRLAGNADNDGFYPFDSVGNEPWRPSALFVPVDPTP